MHSVVRQFSRPRWNATVAALAVAVAGSGPFLFTGTAHADVRSFGFTGGAQAFVVPPGVTTIDVTAHGASGGSGYYGDAAGSRVHARLSVLPGETLWVYVGGQGGAYGAAGFNGGGRGGWSADYNSYTGGGGGATDIRRGAGTLADRMLVAGGGGGGGYATYGGTGDRSGEDSYFEYSSGGDAGIGLHSRGRTGIAPGTGAGGTVSMNSVTAGSRGCGQGQPGVLGTGGDGGTWQPCDPSAYVPGGGGGGGGYWGGGGGAAGDYYNYYHYSSGGGGGSSYADPSAVAVHVVPGGASYGTGWVEITYPGGGGED